MNKLIEKIAALLLEKNWMLVTAESCTGGRVASVCTSLPGSSGWFERGFVSYSNAAKMEMLQVPLATLTQYGAVSEQTAAAMVKGALANSRAQLGVAITGIAGPGGGTSEKPVGLVWFAWASHEGKMITEKKIFSSGSRQLIQDEACQYALSGVFKMLTA